MAIIPKIITLLKTGEQRILERFDGRVRLGIFLLLVFSYGLILFTWSLSFPCMFDMRLSIRASIPFRFVFDASSLTAAFLFLWGVTQAMIMFYMEHRKERILGVTLDRIIFTSMGRELVKATLILFIVEMLFWITAVLTDNHYLMISNLILQLINIVALFSIIYNKQKPRSVIGTCVWETKHERRLWMSRDKKDDKTKEIPKLLAFELMKEENVPTSVSFNEIKDVIRWIYKASDDEDPKLRFEYELNMTERICEIYKEKNGHVGTKCVYRRMMATEIAGSYYRFGWLQNILFDYATSCHERLKGELEKNGNMVTRIRAAYSVLDKDDGEASLDVYHTVRDCNNEYRAEVKKLIDKERQSVVILW